MKSFARPGGRQGTTSFDVDDDDDDGGRKEGRKKEFNPYRTVPQWNNRGQGAVRAATKAQRTESQLIHLGPQAIAESCFPGGAVQPSRILSSEDTPCI